uniref:ATP synthase F0 subunit 8 n=1 Tax=Alectorobius atacamensis TaxID=1826597 RepID=UPI0022373004|nr:ATP synthase F0 subunit 8 [Alectorobius atacamensis]UYB78187.1 ATP synthase F0 subunit 8 [Alectorobius atacamensis]
MPQLFPMNWNLLIILFSSILILTIPLIYFNYKPSLPLQMFIPSMLMKVWKW